MPNYMSREEAERREWVKATVIDSTFTRWFEKGDIVEVTPYETADPADKEEYCWVKKEYGKITGGWFVRRFVLHKYELDEILGVYEPDSR